MKEGIRSFLHQYRALLPGYAALALAILALFNGVLMLSLIPSGSMEGTIGAGDLVLATRYDKTAVNRYDIMVFIPPDQPDVYYIKRVIGLPGETVTVKDGEVYADGVLLDSSFTQEPMNGRGEGVYQVPQGSYFMMGDNRNHSLDSRFWDEKYVPLENMEAKAKLALSPWVDVGSVAYAHP